MTGNINGRGIGCLATESRSMVERLRRGLDEAELDRACREVANVMLDRVGREDDLVRRGGALADAIAMRDGIVAVLELLGELDDISHDEPDRSAFYEIASLFQHIAELAASGEIAATRAVGRGDA
jgi:hypothetical protein